MVTPEQGMEKCALKVVWGRDENVAAGGPAQPAAGGKMVVVCVCVFKGKAS